MCLFVAAVVGVCSEKSRVVFPSDTNSKSSPPKKRGGSSKGATTSTMGMRSVTHAPDWSSSAHATHMSNRETANAVRSSVEFHHSKASASLLICTRLLQQYYTIAVFGLLLIV